MQKNKDAKLKRRSQLGLVITWSCLLLLLGGCGGESSTQVAGSTTSVANEVFRWEASSFPINLRISTAFSSSERSVLQDVHGEWSSSVNNQIVFFNTSDSTSLSTSGISTMGQYVDNEYGVYKVENWSSLGLPSTALAVTQLIALTQNAGTASQFQRIQHADVLINYERFNFSTTGAENTYDLGTVAIHEAGHFLGLQHTASSAINSVMVASIQRADVFTEPFIYDQNTIAGLYSLSGATSALSSSSYALKSTSFQADKEESEGHPDNGRLVRIIMELHADGECHHKKINGDGSVEELGSHWTKRLSGH